MKMHAKQRLGVALLLASATVINRFSPGELLHLLPEEIGKGYIPPKVLAREVQEIANQMRINNCLPRAIALREALRSNGIDAKVLVGATYDREFWGHAWVNTVDGQEFYRQKGLMPWLTLPVSSSP